jgi:hypothetical protein
MTIPSWPPWTKIAMEYWEDMDGNVSLDQIATYMFEIVPEEDRDKEKIKKNIRQRAEYEQWEGLIASTSQG